jgi:hypothetical protein
MLVEVQIISIENTGKSYVAFSQDVRPEIGDTTVGLNSVCVVESIASDSHQKMYKLSDGSFLSNPIKILGELSEFAIENNFFVGGKLFVSCEGTKGNPILVRDGSPLNLVRFP